MKRAIRLAECTAIVYWAHSLVDEVHSCICQERGTSRDYLVTREETDDIRLVKTKRERETTWEMVTRQAGIVRRPGV